MNKRDDISLLEYLNTNCPQIDDDEQKEIESLNLHFDDLNGYEVTLDELILEQCQLQLLNCRINKDD